MPAFDISDREIPGHNSMDREHDRDDGEGKNGHCSLDAVPFCFCSAPAERQCLIEGMPPTCCAVACHCQVRNQRQVKVNCTAEQVGCNCQKIPHQRAAEIWP